jgi:hypothetical protein
MLIAFSVALSGVRLVNATLGQTFLILLQILGIMSILILAERVAAKVRTEFHERQEKTRRLMVSKTSHEEEID